MEAMPLARLASRLIAEEKRKKEEERVRRHSMWIQFCGLFFANRGEAEPPQTREEYKRQKAISEGKSKPKEPSAEEWRQQEVARKQWEALRDMYFKGATSPYYFEEIMYFDGHLFEEPPKPQVETAEELRRKEREELKQGWSSFVESFSESMDRLSEQTGNASVF